MFITRLLFNTEKPGRSRVELMMIMMSNPPVMMVAGIGSKILWMRQSCVIMSPLQESSWCLQCLWNSLVVNEWIYVVISKQMVRICGMYVCSWDCMWLWNFLFLVAVVSSFEKCVCMYVCVCVCVCVCVWKAGDGVYFLVIFRHHSILYVDKDALFLCLSHPHLQPRTKESWLVKLHRDNGYDWKCDSGCRWSCFLTLVVPSSLLLMKIFQEIQTVHQWL